MSDEILDELFRDAAEKIEVEFEPSSWDKLKNRLGKIQSQKKQAIQMTENQADTEF
jgi:ABC-type Fe2+-enterobactin transport system substrate-binding protein